jgi:ribosomal protein S6--L-glutamate ligase
LTSDGTFYSSERLRRAFEERGCPVTLLDPARSPVPGERFDLVVPRLGSRFFSTSLAFLERVVARGSKSAANPAALGRVRRKSSVLLAALPGPARPAPSELLRQDEDLPAALERLGGLPLVAKPDIGTQGIGVAALHDASSLKAYVRTLAAWDEDTLLQPLLRDMRDIRCLVIGDRVPASVSRTPAPDDFRANVHRGASARLLAPGGPWEEAAVALARHVGLEIAGIDFLENRGELLLMEINASPGLRGIESASRLDLAGQIADHCIRCFLES